MEDSSLRGVTCAKCVAPIDVRTMEDCIECPECSMTFCDNCYNTELGDGCHCHANSNSLPVVGVI
jgi:hypothetical protein